MPDGRSLAVAGAREDQNRGVALWSAAEGRWDGGDVDRQLLGLSQEGRAVASSPDGRWLTAGSADGVTIWSMPEAEVVATLDHIADIEETDWVTDLAFSPDSRLLGVGRWTGVLELWEVDPS